MAFTVELYTFSKKLNSTARPSVSGSSYNCVLKDGCGIMSPVIKLDLGLTFSPDGFNYAYIPEFGRYYFVKEWFFLDRLWYCYLEEDTLATWRDNIGSQSFYILRAANAFDGRISDDMYPTMPDPVITVLSPTDPGSWSGLFSSGHFVISVICKGADTGTRYYVTDLAGLQALTSALMNDTGWLNVPQDITQGGIDENLLRTLYNPWQYITSIKWYPFKPDTVAGSGSSSMSYGWWNINLSGGTVETLADSAYHSNTFIFTLTKHPQAAARGGYLNAAPFTRMRLVIPPIGDIVIDPTPFINKTQLWAVVHTDCKTGQAFLLIRDTSYNVYEIRRAEIGVEMPVTQIAVDKLSQAETVITGAAAVARDTLVTGAQATNVSNLINPVAGALETGASAAQTAITATHAIADGIRSAVPQMETRGVRGSTAAFQENIRLYIEHFELAAEDNQNNGRPLCRIRTPASLQGYMLVRDGHVNIAGNAGEIAAVKAYLESGFYYE